MSSSSLSEASNALVTLRVLPAWLIEPGVKGHGWSETGTAGWGHALLCFQSFTRSQHRVQARRHCFLSKHLGALCRVHEEERESQARFPQKRKTYKRGRKKIVIMNTPDTWSVSGLFIISSPSSPFSPEVRVEHSREDTTWDIKVCTCACCRCVLFWLGICQYSDLLPRNRNQMYVWHLDKSTHDEIRLKVLRVSSNFFFRTADGLSRGFSIAAGFLSSVPEDLQQLSLMQSTFPTCCCKFPLCRPWPDSFHFDRRLLTCIFIILCFFSISPPSASSLWLCPCLCSWVGVFNFMPLASAVGPLVSARL